MGAEVGGSNQTEVCTSSRLTAMVASEIVANIGKSLG